MKTDILSVRLEPVVKDSYLAICKRCHLAPRDMMLILIEALEQGEISVKGGRVIATGNSLDLDAFIRACESHRRRPQTVLNSITEQLNGY